MDTIETTGSIHKPLKSQQPQNRLFVWTVRILLGLLVTIVAENSAHYITFDRPDVVIDAIRQVVEAARTRQPLAQK